LKQAQAPNAKERSIPVQNLQLPIPDDGRILFFKRDREIFGFLSNYYDAPITIDGEAWRSTEFYYQAQKSHDPEYREVVRNAKSADHAKGIGSDPRRSKKARKRSWFHGRHDALRTDWHDVKLTVMETAVRAKFHLNPQLQALLLATGDAELVEDSAHDPFWGVGRDGRGENRMGRLLMKVRQELRDCGAPLK
jgi:N-glycosidase YbiA